MDKSKLNDPREWRKFGIGAGLILAAAFAVRTFAFHRPSPVLAAIGLLFLAFGLYGPLFSNRFTQRLPTSVS
ncbi:MAG TPA: hypothetical protein VGB38_00730 [bacterium]